MQLEGMAPYFEVYDMRRSVEFYRDVLGFALKSKSSAGEEFDWALLERDGIELMLNTMYDRDRRPAEEDAERKRMHRDVILFFGCEDLDGAYAEMRAKGVEVKPPVVQPYGMRQVYLKDPDGYGICLQWPAA